MVELIQNNLAPLIGGTVLTIILGIVLRQVKTEKFKKWVNFGEAHGVLLDKMAVTRLGRRNWEIGEKIIVTLIEMAREYLKAVERGIMKNNAEAMAKKKMEDTEEYKALQEAMEKLKPDVESESK